MSAKNVLGREGERAAVGYLEGCGSRIPERNWRSPDGEIDVAAVERPASVACEAKTRLGTRPGKLDSADMRCGRGRRSERRP
jgi:putative endonuclease